MGVLISCKHIKLVPYKKCPSPLFEGGDSYLEVSLYLLCAI